MSDRVFFDTNVVVYAFDHTDPRRQGAASRLLGDALASGSAVFSLQVLQEFFVVVTRKIRSPLAPPMARSIVADLSRHPVVEPTVIHVLRAIDLSSAHRLAYWDALILVTAADAACDRVYSEDFNPGPSPAGVQVVNPFA